MILPPSDSPYENYFFMGALAMNMIYFFTKRYSYRMGILYRLNDILFKNSLEKHTYMIYNNCLRFSAGASRKCT